MEQRSHIHPEWEGASCTSHNLNILLYTNTRNDAVWMSSALTSFKYRFCSSINDSLPMPCIYHQKKEECPPYIKQRQSQHDPPSISRFMKNSMWLMHFCTLYSHIIHNAERQQSSVRFRPRLDIYWITRYSLPFAYSFHHKTTTLVLVMIQA